MFSVFFSADPGPFLVLYEGVLLEKTTTKNIDLHLAIANQSLHSFLLCQRSA